MRLRAGIALIPLVLLLGCSQEPPSRFPIVDPSSGQKIVLRREPVPARSTLTGRYRSPNLGVLVLRQDGQRLEGSYAHLWDGCRVSGTLQGTVVHNLAEFEWRERWERCEEPSAARGTGFFYFSPPFDDGDRTRLFGRRTVVTRSPLVGERSPFTREDAGPWTAVRMNAGGAKTETP